MGLETRANQFVVASFFERFQDLVANGAQRSPIIVGRLLAGFGAAFGCYLRGGREGGQMDALLAARDLRQVPPDFLASKTHDRRKQSHQRFSDVPDRGLSAATAVRLRRRNVEAILEHIEVKRA